MQHLSRRAFVQNGTLVLAAASLNSTFAATPKLRTGLVKRFRKQKSYEWVPQ
ncbi:MAG: hypothetical protein HY000_30980 [Planctomycetes bacterium]|nr:hypothetical protein [Planctomycetota bacterium]